MNFFLFPTIAQAAVDWSQRQLVVSGSPSLLIIDCRVSWGSWTSGWSWSDLPWNKIPSKASFKVRGRNKKNKTKRGVSWESGYNWLLSLTKKTTFQKETKGETPFQDLWSPFWLSPCQHSRLSRLSCRLSARTVPTSAWHLALVHEGKKRKSSKHHPSSSVFASKMGGFLKHRLVGLVCLF